MEGGGEGIITSRIHNSFLFLIVNERKSSNLSWLQQVTTPLHVTCFPLFK